jgi:hypothetical protein
VEGVFGRNHPPEIIAVFTERFPQLRKQTIQGLIIVLGCHDVSTEVTDVV